MRRRYAQFIIFSFVVVLLGAVFVMAQDRLHLTNAAKGEAVKFARPLDSKLPDPAPAEPEIDQRQRLSNVNFIEANLGTMKLTLYEQGSPVKEIDILTKGRDGGWWETPTGHYAVLSRETNHFSSIGLVWMPYSVQFYGNFFIHGWPHYDDGTPVAASYSGGCIRLSTEDAKTVYDFAKYHMPIVVLENEPVENVGWLQSKKNNSAPPLINARAFLISDLSSNKTIVQKNADAELPIASLVKLMTAVSAHELTYLGRSYTVHAPLNSKSPTGFQGEVGESFSGFELLYPLLMQSSNESADLLASFLGSINSVAGMNAKAQALGMNNTSFADPSGLSADNISTAQDISKLLRYIYYKRGFIFDITKGKKLSFAGIVEISNTSGIQDIKNFNEFAKDPDLIGMKNDLTTAAGETMAAVWNIHTPHGDVPVAIIVLGSKDRAGDTTKLLTWLKQNFETL